MAVAGEVEVGAGRSIGRQICVRDLFRLPAGGRDVDGCRCSLPPSDFDFWVFVIWFGVRRQQLGLITVQWLGVFSISIGVRRSHVDGLGLAMTWFRC